MTLSTGRGENQLDENGNPLPIEEETGSEVGGATSDVVQSRKASSFLEDQLPENAVNSAEGKAGKDGKEVVRRGNKTQGKAQAKQKFLKSKKNEIGAKVTNCLELSSSGEAVVHHGSNAAEVKIQKHDCKSQMKSTEEECHGESDDEQQVVSLSETTFTKEDCDHESNEAENALNNGHASLIRSSSQRDSDATDEAFLGESGRTIPEERLVSSRSQTRKKRRKGKQNRSQKPDSTSVAVKISTVNGSTIVTSDPVPDSSSSNLLPVSCVNSVSFCCHQLSNARQKPSARVPPSRPTAVDHGLSSRVVTCVLGDKIDLGEKTMDGISSVENKRMDEEKLCNVEDRVLVKVLSSDSNNTFIVDSKSSSDLETSQPFKNNLVQGLSTVNSEEILHDITSCVTVPASVSVCPLSPSRKQPTLIGPQGDRVKPQSTVNPFSVLDSDTLAKPFHIVNQTLHPNLQSRTRIEPTAGAKPKFNQPPRLKPRSLVNPLRVDQSQQTRVRPHPKFDPVSTSSTALPRQTPNDLPEIRTSTVSDPNPTFRILRRKPCTSLAKHSDSSSFAETKNSLVTTEQCSNSSYGNSCNSDSSPSVAKTAVYSESCYRDNVATTTRRGDVAKKPPNSRLSDHKVSDQNPIPDSIRLLSPGNSIDAESMAGERVSSEFKVGSSTCDRLPSGSRTSSKNTKPVLGHRTNSLSSSQVADDAVTFDLVRAQQYLRAGEWYFLFHGMTMN